MPDKSIWTRISNPRETYTDGYGTQREVSEPGYITIGRKIHDAADKFLNGSEEFNGVPINKGAGSLEFFFDPSSVGKADDVMKLVNNLDKIKDKWDGLARYKLRRKVNSTPKAKGVLMRNIEKKLSKINVIGPDGPEPLSGYYLDEAAYDTWADKVFGDPGIVMKLTRDRKLNPIAKAYNKAVSSGNLDEAAKLKHKLQVASKRSPDDPYVNGYFWDDVWTRLNDPKNGGPGKRYLEPSFDENLPF